MTIGVAMEFKPTFAYPNISSPYKGMDFFFDNFYRTDLNPTGAYELYGTSGTGTPTIATSVNSARLRLSTSGSLNDDANVRTTNMFFRRQQLTTLGNTLIPRNSIKIQAVFGFSSTTDVQIFLGLLNAGTITAIPTTARHLGMFVDTSVDNNIRLSSANGTTQSTTDTGTAISGTRFGLEMNWTGDDQATVSLLDQAGSTLSTHTVSSLLASGEQLMMMHAFIETLAASAKSFDWLNWKVTVT